MIQIYLFAKLAAVCAAMILCCQCFTTEETFGFDYCKHTFGDCHNKTHVLCLFHDFKISPACLSDRRLNVHEDKFLTPDDRVNIVKLHNDLRALVTKGMVPKQPPARNMKIMKWDDELAMMAKVYLVKCSDLDENKTCFTTRHNEKVPTYMIQNLNYPRGFINYYASLIEEWFELYREVPPGVVRNYSDIGKEVNGRVMYLEYTQMVWAKTDKVGCERMTSSSTPDPRFYNDTMLQRYKNYTIETLFCLYSPRGNIVGEPVYEAGEDLEWVVDTQEDDVATIASARDIVPGALFLHVVAISLVRLISA